jgi:hypothetical protein
MHVPYVSIYIYIYIYVCVSEYVHKEKGTTVIKYLETPLYFPWKPQLMIM